MRLRLPVSTLLVLGMSTLFTATSVYADDTAAADKPAGGGNVHKVETLKYKFIPDDITIKVGDTIRWVNVEKRQYHSVWFREAGEAESEYFFPDETFEKTFDKPGDFPYVCGPHEKDYNMVGTVHVEP